MNCRRCESPLERPGDYCLTCDTANCDTVVVTVTRERATLTMLDGDEEAGEFTVTTIPEDDDGERGVIELRNFAGLVADEVHRKRPDEVYVSGDHRVIREIRAQLHHDVFRVRDQTDPVGSVLARRGERALEVVEAAPTEKLGGSHTTLIGGRDGRKAIGVVAEHPHVKKVVPGPIDAGGMSSRKSLRAKVTRADGNGNVRLLLRDGSSVQENRVVTTAMDRETGERVREDLNAALEEEGLQDG
jgi:hypothetical protein